MVSAERRLAPLQAAQERGRAEIGKGGGGGEGHQATKAAVDALRAECRPIYQVTYGEYKEARSQLPTRQQGERDQLKALWAKRQRSWGRRAIIDRPEREA